MRYTATYNTWKKMKARLRNPHREVYARIDMDPRWESYDEFYADMGDRPEGHSIDRIDNDRGYWPDNCRWATPKQQQSNLKNNLWLEYGGERLILSEWARKVGKNMTTLLYRYRKGWSPEEVLYGKKG